MAEESVHEEWRPVVGYEGLYEVSSIGRLRRLFTRPGGGAPPGLVGGTVMKVGYRQATLGGNGSLIKHYLHALVCAAFIGPRPSGHQVNHKNGNRLDNRAENLEYVTHQENMRHAREVLGTMDNRGEKMGTSKLKTHDVLEIRRRFAAGERSPSIAMDYPVTVRNIRAIGRRESWRHVA